MRKIYYCLTATLAFACIVQLVIAQPMSDTQKNDLEALKKLNAQFIRNFVNMDSAAHSQIVHRDFICIESSGAIVKRAEYLKEWATGYKDSGYASFWYEDELIRIFGNTALVRSKTPWTRSKDGVITKGASVYTDTYIKENGRWWCVQAQITAIRQ